MLLASSRFANEKHTGSTMPHNLHVTINLSDLSLKDDKVGDY